MDLTSQTGAGSIFALTILASLLALHVSPNLLNRCLFRPYWFVRAKQYGTIFTSGFVHADMTHLIFNMITFWFFAFQLERHIGTGAFVVLYAAGLVISHGCTYYKHKNNQDYASLGASGAISAVLFAYIIYFPATTLIILPFPFPIPAALFAVGYVAYSYWAAARQRGRINHDAHLCGALSGVLFVAVSDPGAFSELPRLLR